MGNAIDFQARLESIHRIFAIGEYATAATECVKISEQALRYVLREYQEQLDGELREKLEKAIRKRNRHGGGAENLTMGQLVRVMKESGFLDAWTTRSGNAIDSLPAIDLEKLTQLRNRIMHDAAEASRTDAEFLLHCLKIFLESFNIVTFKENPPERTMNERSHTEGRGTQQITINGTASGNIFVRGDRNVATVQLEQVNLGSPADVDMLKELSAIREALVHIESPDKGNIDNAISDAEDELKKAQPDKDEVGQALDRALNYAKKAENFAGVMEKLKPHIANAATWLGSNWHKILAVVGLVV